MKIMKKDPHCPGKFRRAGKEEQIALIEGDAAEVMKKLEGPFDSIFMDAAKGSISIICPRLFGFCRREVSLCLTM